MSGNNAFTKTKCESRLSIGQCASLACLLECTAPKPGNVHRGADFEDLTFTDFLVSAAAIAPAMQSAAEIGVGAAILEATQATQRLVATNTNLGLVLLLAPLAAVARDQPLSQKSLSEVLAHLSADDAHKTYQAIRLANPGGMAKVDEMDIADQPPEDLLAAMRAAAARDLVARQYANNFKQLFEAVVPWLCEGEAAPWTLTQSIIHAHLRMMADFPDSLIARKCGLEVAQESADRAGQALNSGDVGSSPYEQSLADLDFWLRNDHHRRNPGTTADFLAAGLFVVLRDEIITPPFC